LAQVIAPLHCLRAVQTGSGKLAMAIIGEETSWLSSTASFAQRKVSRQVNGIVKSCSSKMDRWVHPDGVVAGSKVGDTPDEPRQWSAFEFADIMEQGLSGGLACSFVEVLDKDCEARFRVRRSPDKKEFLLTTNDGSNLLLARQANNGEGFSIFVMGEGEPPRALGPAFSLRPNSDKDQWTLQANTCDMCESRGRRLCGSRQLAFISHHVEKCEQCPDAQICCLDMEIPALDRDGVADIWCPMCRGQDAQYRYSELTTRKPRWNAKRSTLSLDFFGRCTMASAKNFQLEVAGKPDKVKLLFGKVGISQFVLDFQRPLSPIQAFAAAISTTAWK